jgi:hypothetical protein
MIQIVDREGAGTATRAFWQSINLQPPAAGNFHSATSGIGVESAGRWKTPFIPFRRGCQIPHRHTGQNVLAFHQTVYTDSGGFSNGRFAERKKLLKSKMGSDPNICQFKPPAGNSSLPVGNRTVTDSLWR